MILCQWKGFDHKRVKKILKLNYQSHVVMVIGVGKNLIQRVCIERFRIDDNLVIKIVICDI